MNEVIEPIIRVFLKILPLVMLVLMAVLFVTDYFLLQEALSVWSFLGISMLISLGCAAATVLIATLISLASQSNKK